MKHKDHRTVAIEDLKNTGLVELWPERRPVPDEPHTLVVVGPARSGTSAVAGVLHHLGVFMGDRANPPVFEDVRLAQAIERSTPEDAREIVDGYDARYPVWGYKRPAFLERAAELAPLFRRPQFLVTFKDLLAIANRNRISVGQDLAKGLRRAHAEYGAILDFVTGIDASVLLISYEKLMSRPRASVEQIAQFCGIAAGEGRLAAAARFLVPDPAHYIDSSRLTKTQGSLDRVSTNAVTGWARYVASERPATVVLCVDGVEVARTAASHFRKDLLDKGVHSTGHCAYRFEGLGPEILRPGSEVRVRVSDDVVDLKNSPRRVPS